MILVNTQRFEKNMYIFDILKHSKGQLISKGLFGVYDSSKKTNEKTKKLRPNSTKIPQVELFSFVFWKN